MICKYLTHLALFSGLMFAAQDSAQAQGNLTGTQFGSGSYTGGGQGYYGGYGQGYGAYGSGYSGYSGLSTDLAPGYPTVNHQTYQAYPDTPPSRSYNSFGNGRYGSQYNPIWDSPNYGFGNRNFGVGGYGGYGGYGYGAGGLEAYLGLPSNYHPDGFGGTGAQYHKKGSPYSRF